MVIRCASSPRKVPAPAPSPKRKNRWHDVSRRYGLATNPCTPAKSIFITGSSDVRAEMFFQLTNRGVAERRKHIAVIVASIRRVTKSPEIERMGVLVEIVGIVDLLPRRRTFH